MIANHDYEQAMSVFDRSSGMKWIRREIQLEVLSEQEAAAEEAAEARALGIDVAGEATAASSVSAIESHTANMSLAEDGSDDAELAGEEGESYEDAESEANEEEEEWALPHDAHSQPQKRGGGVDASGKFLISHSQDSQPQLVLE